MRDLLALLFQIGFTIFIVLVGVRLATAISDDPQAAGHPRLDVSSATIWTTEPTKVDPGRQGFERLPGIVDPYPLKFAAGRKRMILSNAEFKIGETRFRLQGVEPVPRNKVCADVSGRRFACGLSAYKALDNLISRKSFECRPLGGDAGDMLVECRIGDRDLRDFL